ncbi:MAG: cobaltochelatase subunit CobT, partial [Pseudomonadota bacterium]
MVSNPDNPAESFKKALAEATRVLADDPDLDVTYSVDPPGMTEERVRLPQISRRMTREEVLLARGTADAFALRRKYHDPSTYNRYTPAGKMARDLYDAMETARYEVIGAREMPGTSGNIDAKISHEARRRGYDQLTQASEAPLAMAAGYLIRSLATERALPESAQNVLDLWRAFMEAQAGKTLSDLSAVLDDQAAFAKFARRMIDDLGYGDQLGEDPDAEDEGGDEDAQADDQEDRPDSTGQDDQNDEEVEAASERSQHPEQDDGEAQITMDDAADAEVADEADMPEGEAPPPPTQQPISEASPDYEVYAT